MEWVRKPGFENIPIESKPRNLTDDERENILNQIPSVQGATQDARDAANKIIRYKADVLLTKIKITPLAIPELIEDMIRKFEKSRVVPETAVGISAAEAVGRVATQQTLNSFHVSGSSKSQSYGLEGMKEMINATKNRKNPSCTIVFKNKKMSYLETLRKRREIVGITVGRLMIDYEIEEPRNLQQYSWHKTYPLITGKKIPSSQFVMRIYLDLNIMFQHQVTMERICNTIEERNPGLSYIHSPLPFLHDGKRLAIIDIYPQENIISEVLTAKKISTIDRPALIFLKSVFLPSFKNLTIQGIPGITAVYTDPKPYHILRIIRSEIRQFPDDSPALIDKPLELQTRMKNIWVMLFNKLQMRLTGIGRENLERLFDLTGVVAHEWSDNYVIAEIPQQQEFKFTSMTEEVLRKAFPGPDITFQKLEDRLTTVLISEMSPSKYIQKVVSVSEQAEVENYDQNRKKGIYLPPLDDPIITASRFFTLETTGTNLKELLSRDDVDTEHTYSNDFHEITRVLGADAAKCFYIRELLNIVGEDSVEPRHVRLIADFVFNQGRPLGLTFAGISRQPIGYLDLASFQKSVETFSRAALYGRSEKIIGASSSISVGKRIGVGTGALGLSVDYKKAYEGITRNHPPNIEELKRRFGNDIDYKKLYEEELLQGKSIDIQVTENAVEDLDEQTFGNEDLQFTGEYDEGVSNFQDSGIIQPALPFSKERIKARVSGKEEEFPTTTESISNKAPTVSPELIEVLKMLSTVPAYPNAGTTRLHISPLRHGLIPIETTEVVGISSKQEEITEVSLPPVTFIEPEIEEEVERLPGMHIIRDEDI